VLFAYLLVDRRILTSHETVHCQNVREMLADHDWIIPHYGGRVWLERPPLPHWITAVVVSLFNPEKEWPYRLSSALVGLIIVLIVASAAAQWYGRTVGFLSGGILATMLEFKQYATGPEADIHLCLLTTGVLTVFARLEFGTRSASGEDVGFLGWRSWPVLAFFILLGLTNLAKGLFFGTVFACLPVIGFLFTNRNGQALRRYIWFWGWLACAATASVWAILAWLRHPGVVELWKSDYLGRVNTGYMHEPFWYYFANLPLILMPWTGVALLGLGLTARRMMQPQTPERYLWCWAVLPILFFSLLTGKHHHYLLHCLAPWSVLSALGAIQLWQWLTQGAGWFRHPITGLILLALPLEAALLLLGHRVPGPPWIRFALLAGIPPVVGFTWWATTRPNGRLACAALFGLALTAHCLAGSYRTHCWETHRDDIAFLHAVRRHNEHNRELPLFVLADLHPLNASWVLFYLGEPAHLLHNVTFLRDDRVGTEEVLVVAHAFEEASLKEYGTPHIVLQSRRSHGETSPADRWTLFRLRFHNRLVRVRGDVYISPMQATGRAPGPYLP
jgi:4-amino-4-deoxy-L-arabinose transferase-like glycosyltransferase